MASRRLQAMPDEFSASDLQLFNELKQLISDSEEQYREIVDSINDGVFQLNAGGYFAFVNSVIVERTGIPEYKFHRLHFKDIVVSEDYELAKNNVAKVLRGENVAPYELRCKTFGGRILTLEVNTGPIYECGRIVALLGISRDITERVKRQEKLRENEARFRAFFERAAVGVAQLDSKSGRTVMINQRYCDIVGYTMAEVQEISLQSLTHPEDLNAERANMNLLMTGQIREFSMDKRHLRKDGESVWVNLTVSPMWEPGKDPISHIAIVQNIAERKRMEDEIRTLATIDSLTGLYNRRGFLHLSEQQLKISERTKKGLILIFLDLDNMKKINDTWGHLEGDKALTAAAMVLNTAFRGSDIIARIGGDEFAVLAQEMSKEYQHSLMNRLRHQMHILNVRKERPYDLSMSYGLVEYDPEHPCSLEDLMLQADVRMYDQKRKKEAR
jgi:diguanylate cyclase (GGDEF)-like protein/PAS domain S-box-containing protein